MLRFTARALAACASIAAITLLASRASAQLPQQRLLQTIQPTAEDFGPNGEDPEAGPELGRAVVIRDGLAFIGLPGRELPHLHRDLDRHRRERHVRDHCGRRGRLIGQPRRRGLGRASRMRT